MLILPFFNNLLQIDSQDIKFVLLRTATLVLQNPGSSKEVMLEGSSGDDLCQVKLKINFLLH